MHTGEETLLHWITCVFVTHRPLLHAMLGGVRGSGIEIDPIKVCKWSYYACNTHACTLSQALCPSQVDMALDFIPDIVHAMRVKYSVDLTAGGTLRMPKITQGDLADVSKWFVVFVVHCLPMH